MDEEDSQDELINRNASHGKGKRLGSAIMTDEEDVTDEGGDNSEESENGSEEGEMDEESGDEEDGEEDYSNDSCDGEEDSGKAPEGATGAASGPDLSSDEDTEKCPICLNSFHQQPVATPDSCEHYFCLDCILEWAKNASSCPVDRIIFKSIYLRKCYGGRVQKTISIPKPARAAVEEPELNPDLDQTNCEICGQSDREDRLLLCDGCDMGYHMECLTPPLSAVPVEEWFCPACAGSNPSTGGSGDEVREGAVIPLVVDSSRSSSARPTRAIARTWQSERVRATVNRNRISQARGIQQVPGYPARSTWLDVAIEAVVAGLNTAEYVRDLTPRARTGRRRAAKRRRGAKKKAKGPSEKSGRKRKRRVRRPKSRRKQVVRKAVTSRSRLAMSLGITRQGRSSSIPAVYRPGEQSLGSMRADIGAASLSVYGDPFDLDPFDEGDEPGPSQRPDAKRPGLSRSALRSHQPVARPIPTGLHRQGPGIPETEGVAAAPVPDLLGSILTGQSILMMDSSEIVINRDGSLKAIKPVTISSPKTRIPSGAACESGAEIRIGASASSRSSAFNSSGEGGLSSGFPARPSPPFSFPSPSTPTSPQPSSFTPQRHPALPGGSRVPLGGHADHRRCSEPSPRSQDVSGLVPCVSPSMTKDSASLLVSKPPPKPVWMDISGLPRIPKIKRETPSGTGLVGIPDSGTNILTSHRIRQQTTGRGTSGSERDKGSSSGSTRQRPSEPGAASAVSGPLPSNPGPSTVSFRISSSGNPWHARRLGLTTAQGSPGGQAASEPWKKLCESKRTLLSSREKGDEKQGKNEIYDPFEPTGSDSDSPDNASENEASPPGRSDALQPPCSSSDSEVKTEPCMAGADECLGDEEEGEENLDCIQRDSFPEVCKPEEVNTDPLSLSQRKERDTGDDPECRVCKEGVSGQAGMKLPQTSTHSNSASSDHSEINVKPEPSGPDGRRSRTRSRSPLGVSAKQNRDLKQRRTARDNSSASSSPDTSWRKETRRSSVERRPQSSHSWGRRGGTFSSDSMSEDEERCRRKWRRSQSRDRRRSRSGSGDRSRRRNHRRDSREQKDDRQRGSKEKRRGNPRSQSRSRSRSRSRERRKDRMMAHPTTKSKEGVRSRSEDDKCPRSRSWSREKKADVSPSNSSQSTQKSSQETLVLSEAVAEEKEAKEIKLESSASLSREIKASMDIMKEEVADEDGGHPSMVKQEKTAAFNMLAEPQEHKEIKKVGLSPDLFGRLKDPHEIKEESPISLEMVEDSRCPKSSEKPPTPCLTEGANQPKEAKVLKSVEIKQESSPSHDGLACKLSQDAAILASTAGVDLQKQIKTESAWAEEFAHLSSHNVTEVLLSGPSQPAVTGGCHMGAAGSTLAENVSKTGLELQHPLGSVKLEALSADDIANVGRILNSLTSMKLEGAALPEAGGHEMSTVFYGTSVPKQELSEVESGRQSLVQQEDLSVTKTEGTFMVSLGQLPPVKQEYESLFKWGECSAVKKEGLASVCQGKEEDTPTVKATTDPPSMVVSTRSKPSVKRVTWNLKEADKPVAEKSGKLSQLKLLQSSREASRRSPGSNQAVTQDSSHSAEPAAPVGELAPHFPKKVTLSSVSHSAPCGLEAQPGQSQPSQGESASRKEGGAQDASRKDKYMKKLHMQERAVEEVKLAIKPFYQKRDITKEEYKEILRKAVQKVCHSKSGEINPVKVANLVKAYVDKYKHARKHKKNGEEEKAQESLTGNATGNL